MGLAAACDYVLASENAAVKLSEFTIGIGPFVIEPVVQRKIGLAALSELTLDATNWKTAYWAKEKGLYARVFETVKELDEEVAILASKLASYNPSALAEMKKVPDLVFYLDDSLDYIEKIDRALEATNDPIKNPESLDSRKKK